MKLKINITAPLYNNFFLILISIIPLLTNCKSQSVKPQTPPDVNSGSTNTNGSGSNSGGTNVSVSQVPLKSMFGINSYEWNFLDANNPLIIYEPNMALIQSFSAVRHYMDWDKLENVEGSYTFNPTHNGGWNYDIMYTRCKQAGILVLADLKTCPPWLVSTYPTALQDAEDVPAPYGLDRSDPASYVKQARVAFQFAARYGANTTVDKSLVKVDATPRWTNDQVNVVKIGMGLIKYIECDNERDKWWKGPQAEQSPEEYAANMSAFYDGNKGKLGANAGVKTADPSMLVVMGGLASADPTYVSKMIAWCKTNRGTKADGSVNLCFDVINYHYYPTNSAGIAVAPELSQSGSIADSFIKVAASVTPQPEVWITESGYDINAQSTQRAIAIGSKSALITQADWLLRAALLYMRHGLSRSYFYQLFDDSPNSSATYGTSGLAESPKRRPAADYIVQTTKLMGDYVYVKTLSTDPLVDQYQSGSKTMYILTIPDQKGRTGTYTLDLGTAATATLYNLKPGADAMTSSQVNTTSGKLAVAVAETPVFVSAN